MNKNVFNWQMSLKCIDVIVSGSSLMTMWSPDVRRMKPLSKTLAELMTTLVLDNQRMHTCLSTYASHISVC